MSETFDVKAVEEKIVEILKNTYDPEIPVNIYELGLVYGIQVDPAGDVKITMTLTAPNCPAAQSLPAEVKRKTEEIENVKSADVDVVFDPPWTPDKMADSAKLVMNIL